MVGVDVSVDRTHAHIAVAGTNENGLPQVELVATNLPIEGVLPWLKARSGHHGEGHGAAQGRARLVADRGLDLGWHPVRGLVRA
jgi:hypothetical protein